MDLIECPHCRTRVLATSNGDCPACQKPLDSLVEVIETVESRKGTGDGGSAIALVTIARFGDVIEATLARNCLEDAGIQAFLADAETATVAWQLTNALGGIKLQVAELDAERALVVLEQQHAASPVEDEELTQEALASSPEPGEEDEETSPEDDGPDEPEPLLTPREQDAERAFRAAVFGLIFVPLQFYVTYLLLLVLFSGETLAGRPRGRAKIAATINIFYMLIFYILFRSVSGFR